MADVRLFDTHFARFGYAPLKSIRREPAGVHFVLPAGVKEVSQTGLYSYVGLSGDFEYEVSYEWTEIPTVKGGYGMTVGIAVDTLGKEGQVMLSRGFQPGKKEAFSCYAIVQGKLNEAGIMEYKQIGKPVPTNARVGGLVIRREKGELIFLAADGQAALTELQRMPFTTATVRQIRLYADPGGSPTALDAWIGQLRVRAQEITGGFPKRERKEGWGWWLWLAFGAAVAAAGYFVYRWLSRDARPAVPSPAVKRTGAGNIRAKK